MVEMIISLLKLGMSLGNKSISTTLIHEFTFICIITSTSRCVQSYCEKNDLEQMRDETRTFISFTTNRDCLDRAS